MSDPVVEEEDPSATVTTMTDEEVKARKLKDALWLYEHLIDGHKHTKEEAMEVILDYYSQWWKK